MRETNDSERPRLSQLGEFIRGRGGTKADARSCGIPCVRYGELYTTHHDVIRQFRSYISADAARNYTPLRRGDVVFAGSGETLDEIGKAAAYCDDATAVVGADTILLRTNAHAHAAYLGYAANSTDVNRQKATLGHGSSVMHIGARELGGVRLFVPPLPEQRQIATILDTLDDAIRKTEQILAKLKHVKQALLHDLLTRGIDDNGELRDPERHPEQFKDSALGRIPRGWEVIELRGCLVGTPTNGIYKPANMIGRGTLLVGQTAFTAERSVDPNLARRAVVTAPELERYGLAEGDVLVSRVFATVEGVGQPALVPRLPEAAVYESNMMRLRVDRGVIRPELLFEWLRSPGLRWVLEARVNASNQASINQQGLNSLPIGRPPAPEQARIVDAIASSDRRRHLELSSLEKFRLLRSGLMEDLLTGRVRVTALLPAERP